MMNLLRGLGVQVVLVVVGAGACMLGAPELVVAFGITGVQTYYIGAGVK